MHRLLDNVLKTLTATSLMSLVSVGADGHRQRHYHWSSAHIRLSRRHDDAGTFFAFNIFFGLLIAPVFQIVAIGTQITEGDYRSGAHARNSEREAEDEEPGRNRRSIGERSRRDGKRGALLYDTRKEVLHEVSFRSDRERSRLWSAFWRWNPTIIGLLQRFMCRRAGACWSTGWISRR